MISRILALALCASAFAAGCDGCTEPLGPIAPGLPVGVTESRVLLYVGEDPFDLNRGAQGRLRFMWKSAEGLPIPGATVVVSASGNTAHVIGDTFVTDSGGAISVPVVASAVDGQTVVTASANDVDGTPRTDSVTVRVKANPKSTLRVRVTSTARIPVATADVRVLLGATPPSCAALLGGAEEPSAQVRATVAAIPSRHEFTDLPTGARATVVATGITANGNRVARGCTETAALPGGQVLEATVTLAQDPTVLVGDYDVLMHVALGDALPEPYDGTIDLVTALLADPAGYAMYAALREMDRQFGTVFVTRNGIEKTYREVEEAALANPSAYATWQTGRDNLDRALAERLGETYVAVTNVGAGVRDLVTDFEVGARLALTERAPTAFTIEESWRELVLYWPLPCADGDLACARRPLTLEDPSLAPVAMTYGATYAHAPVGAETERFTVVTDAHGLNVRYGALLVAILNQVVFPSLPAEVAGDRLGDVLSNMVRCEDVAAALVNDPVASLLVAGVCDAGLGWVGARVEQSLIDLDVDAVSPTLGQEGLAAHGTFVLIDANTDLITELVQGYSFDVAWNTPADAAVTADIAAPITGDGIRALPACSDDEACELGHTCQPRPSYLRVARVDLGCALPVGEQRGGASCATDSDCRSGLCAAVGSDGAFACFAACDAVDDCGALQVCSDAGGLVDLDSAMDGLGTVSVRGCTSF